MPTLYIVATPIGNLKDISYRAVEVLNSVNYIACEDTRVAKKLLSAYGITNKKLISYYDVVEEEKAEKIIKILQNEDVALISDAGTPCISDPGYKVVKKARENNIKVVAIPGAFAGAVALSASGLPSDKFLFVGFLNQKKIKEELKKYKEIGYTFIVYESPKRIMKTLYIYNQIMPNSDIVVAKELTKIHEEYIYGKPKDIIDFFEKNKEKLKGEFVILAYPEKEENIDIKEVENYIKKNLKNKTKKDLVKEIIEKFGIKRNVAYDLVNKIVE